MTTRSILLAASRIRARQTLLVLSTAISFWTPTACASASQNRQPSVVSRVNTTAATVTVHNEQWADMRVYVVYGAAEYRLGTVPAMSSATFRVPKIISGPSELRFLAASLTGDESRLSEAVTVFAGYGIEFTIGQTRALSSLFVRNHVVK